MTDKRGDEKSQDQKCPFEDPEFTIPVDERCPVCGATGRVDSENPHNVDELCVD